MLIVEWTDEIRRAWDEWLKEHEPVRALAERFPPVYLYRLKTTGQRVHIVSFSEDDTLTVAVQVEYNPLLMVNVGHNVFGIRPDDLERCPESEREVIEAEKKEAEMAPVIGAFRELFASDLGMEIKRAYIRDKSRKS